MSELSEVSILYGQHVVDVEKAREIFTTETRRFVRDLLASVTDVEWSSPKVQIRTRDTDLETEERVTSLLTRQKAVAIVDLCFKIKVRYVAISEIKFGVEFDPTGGSFAWRIELAPEGKYQWLDEIVWAEWQKSSPVLPPGAKHLPKEGVVVFVSRRFGPELTSKAGFDDLQGVFNFGLTLEPILVTEFEKLLTVDGGQASTQ